jgi:Tol biopolymer transport system component
VPAASALALGLGLIACLAGPAGAATTQRVSVPANGGQSNDQSTNPAVSADGRFVAFESFATNLVPPADADGSVGVFVRDRRAGTTRRASVGLGGVPADGRSFGPAISGGGRYVAFHSDASNLVPGDTNGRGDVFVRDLQAGTTARASLGADGAQAEGDSFSAAVSGGGRYVAFASAAGNLVPGDTNGAVDVFVRDLVAGTTRRVSLRSGGAQGNGTSDGPAVSADGRFVAFVSQATNLVPGDTNGRADVFVHELATGATRRVSVGPKGSQGNRESFFPALSADGRHVAFASLAGNLVPGDGVNTPDVFVRDLAAGTTRRVSVRPGGGSPNGGSTKPSISADGRRVAFRSAASNLVPGDTNGTIDVFVRDLAAGTTRRVSLRSGGAQPDDVSDEPAISADGRVVAFQSPDDALVPGDTNNRTDVFVRVP